MPKRDPYAQSQQPVKAKTLWDLLPPELAAPLKQVDRAATKARTPPKRTVPKSRTTVTRTTVKGDFGGGGDFDTRPGTIPYKPPPSRPSMMDPVTKIVSGAGHAVSTAAATAVTDALVPHKTIKGRLPPKSKTPLFSGVEEPTPEQHLLAIQAQNVAAQMRPLEATARRRKNMFDVLDERLDAFIKANAEIEGEGKNRKLIFKDDASLKRAREMETKLNQAGDRLGRSVDAYQDKAGRIYELDQAYQKGVTIKPPPPAPPPDPFGLRDSKPLGIPGLTPAKGVDFGVPKNKDFRTLFPAPDYTGEDRGAHGIPFVTPALGVASRAFHGLLSQVRENQRQELYGEKGYEDAQIRKKQAELGRQLTLGEEKTLRAGIVPPGSTEAAVNLGAAAGGGVVGAFEDPVGTVKDTGKLIAESGLGAGLLFVAMADPRAGYGDWYERSGEMFKGARKAYSDIASPSMTPSESFAAGRKHPVATLSLLPLPASALAQGSRIAFLMSKAGGGHKYMEAVRIARDPTRIGKGRMLDYTERGAKLPGGGRQADVKTSFETDWSKSVLWRNTGQRTYDAMSWVLEQLPGARMLPMAEGKRALAAEAKNIRMDKHRRSAKAHAVYKDLLDFVEERNGLGRKVNQHFKTTIAMLVQKPKGFTDEEWERAVMSDLTEMMDDPEHMILSKEDASPAEQRIIRRIDRYRKEEEQGKYHKRNLTMKRISEEQHRLAFALKDITDRRHALYDEYLDAQNDPDLRGAARTEEFGKYEAGIKALDSQAKVARESLDDLSVDQAPILSPQRDQMRGVLERIPYFKDYPEAIDDALAVGDASARASAYLRKTDPADEWAKIHTMYSEPSDIPVEAAAQVRQNAGRPKSYIPTDKKSLLHGVDSSEGLRVLLDGEPADIADHFGLDTVKEPQVKKAQKEIYKATQTSLVARGLPETVVVWRQGPLEPGQVQSFSLKRNTSTYTDQVPYMVARKDILGDSNAFLPNSYTGEHELLIKGDKVTPPRQPLYEVPRSGEYPHPSPSGRTVYNAKHDKEVTELENSEADWKVKREIEDEKDPIRVAAQQRLATAREQELFTRIRLGSRTFNGLASTHPGRKAVAEKVVSKYRGRSGALPPGARKAPELEQLMSLLDELATHGEHGRYWYEKSSHAITDLARGNKKVARQIAQLVAIYSPQKAVIPNLGAAIEAYNAWRMHLPISNGQTWQKEAAFKVLEGKGDWDGRKTNNFYRNFLEDIDPAAFKTEKAQFLKDKDSDTREIWGREVTADMWMARVFGYLGKIVPEGRYDVIEDLVRQLADERGWKPKQMQAAIWTAVKDVSDDVSANVDFAEAIQRHHGYVNWEAAVGTSFAGPFGELYNALPAASKQAFLYASAHLYDQFLVDTNLLGHITEFGPGAWERQVSPGAHTGFVTGGVAKGEYKVDEGSRRMMQYAAASAGRANLQDAIGWARGYIPTTKGHADTIGVDLGRRLGDDEARQLMEILNPEGGDLYEPFIIAHAGNDGFFIRRNPDLADDVLVNFLTGKRYPESFQAKAHDAIEAVFPGVPSEQIALLRTDGELLWNEWKNGDADYVRSIEAALGDTGVSAEALRLRQRADLYARETAALRDEFTVDHVGAARRYSDELGERARARTRLERKRARAVTPDAPRGPPTPPMAQARKGDVLGATQLLNTQTGERIIWLTEHADYSTVLHELVGHATHEMKQLYPDEFALVEQMRSKPYDDWTTEDHEWFAGMFEHYLAEGNAPTPELVDVFERSKQYMRVIAYALNIKLGRRIPPATRDLFDHYLGGYAEESTSRVAVNMGRFDPSDPGAAGARVKAQGELASLQKRNATRRYNESLEGKVARYTKMVKERDSGDLSQEELEQITAEIYRMAGEIQMRADKRVQHLDGKLKDMQKALTRDPNNRRFEGAVAAARWMTEDRERILREVFGSDFDQIFSDRADIVANYLAQKGLISPDFEKGTAGYWPHKLEETWLQSLKLPMMPTNNVVGKLQRSLLGLHKRNEMIRWQAGDWSSDPSVLWQAHSRATSYQFMSEIKKLLHGMGRKLTADEWEGRFPPGAMLVNIDGTPISLGLKEGLKGASNTHSVDRIDDGLFGDNDMLEASLKKYWSNSVVDPNDLPPDFNLTEHPELRVISRAAVNKMFRPITLNLGWGGKGWDIATTMARFSLIYANVPGYMLTNGIGNIVFLGMQSPFNLPRAVWYSKMLLNDSHLRQQIYGEVGELPAFAAITRGRNFGQRIGETALAGERTILDFESIVDRWPRMISWLREANAAGYYRKDDLLRLINGKGATAVRDRRRVAEYSNQHMIDFAYRVSDAEKAILGRAFFIWPYIRGATAMPFWYAKNYPGRTAALAVFAQQQVERQEEMLGQLPPGREDLYPVSRKGTKAEVIPTRFFSPAGPLPDQIKLLSDTIASMNGRAPDNLSARLATLISPLAESGIQIFTGRDYFGRDVSMRDQLLAPYGVADSLLPYIRYVRAAFWDKDNTMTPRAFREGEDTLPEKLLRQVVRINKQTVSVPWLSAQAQARGTKTTDEKIKDAVAANMKHFHEVEGSGAHYSNALRKQVAAKVIYEDRLHELALDEGRKAGFEPTPTESGLGWDTQYHPDAYDKAVVAYEVLDRQFNDMLVKSKLPPPNDFLRQERLPPRSEQGLLVASVYNDLLEAALITPPGPKGIEFASSYDSTVEAVRLAKRLEGEKKRGVYRGAEARQRALRASRG